MKDPNAKRPPSGFDMDILVGYILLCGTLLSAAFLMAGLFWRWEITGRPEFHYVISDANFFRFMGMTLQQIRHMAFRPRLLANIGIAILLLTPYIRVLASMLYFGAVERNIKYTLFTAFVFSVLTYSLLR